MDTTGGETITGVSTSRMIPDENLPNTARSVIVRTTLSEETNKSLAGNLIFGVQQSLATKMRSLYQQSLSDYYYGPTKAKIFSVSSNKGAVVDVLETMEGSPIDFLYFKLGRKNYLHSVWQTLVSSHGYDPVTNKLGNLSATKGTDVFLVDIILNIKLSTFESAPTEAIRKWGAPPTSGPTPYRINEGDYIEDPTNHVFFKEPVVAEFTPNNVGSDISSNTATIRYAHVLQGTDTDIYGEGMFRYTGEFTVPLDDPGFGNYYQVKYTVGTGISMQIKYWSYLVGAGTYPIIDDIENSETNEIGQFFPNIRFVYNAQNQAAEVLKDTDAFKSSKRLCDIIGLDYQEIGGIIWEEAEVRDKVTNGILSFGVPMTSTDPIAIRYLFDFFKQVSQFAETLNYEAATSKVEEVLGVPTTPDFYMTVGNTGNDPYGWDIGFHKITRKLVPGSIGAVGTYASVEGEYDWEGGGWNSIIHGFGYKIDGGVTEHIRYTQKQFTYRKQLDPHVYEEITVIGPGASYKVTNRHLYRASNLDTDLLIPLDYAITSDYNFIEAERLYGLGMNLVFCSRDSVKVDWYESEAFSMVVTIAALVITVLTMPTQVPQVVSATLGITGTAAVAIDVISIIALNAALAYGFGKLAKEIGLENAIVIAAVALATSAYTGFNGPIAGLPTAKELLFITNGLVGGIQETLEGYMKDLEGSYSDFIEYSKEAEAELDRAKELLGTGPGISAWDVMTYTPLFIMGESPDEYYQRTIHSGNVGIKSIEAISTYVDNMLALPKPYQTLPEM